jgi:hypothetical protein
MRWNKRGEGDGRSYQIRLGTEVRLYRSTLDKGYNAIERSQSSGTEQASPSPLSKYERLFLNHHQPEPDIWHTHIRRCSVSAKNQGFILIEFVAATPCDLGFS